MNNTAKRLLISVLPAAACTPIWLAGIATWLLIVDRRDILENAFVHNPVVGLWEITACFASAWLSGAFLSRLWLKSSSTSRALGWAILHETLGAALFGTFLIPGAGTVCGFLLAFPLMPVQILGSFAFILLHRHLARRFSLMADGPKENP